MNGNLRRGKDGHFRKGHSKLKVFTGEVMHD